MQFRMLATATFLTTQGHSEGLCVGEGEGREAQSKCYLALLRSNNEEVSDL